MDLKKQYQEFLEKHIYARDFNSPYFMNYLIGHYQSLKISYPNIEKILGAETFRGLCFQYLMTHPPQDPDLNKFGQVFPEFILKIENLDILWLRDLASIDKKFYMNFERDKELSLFNGVMSLWERLEQNLDHDDIEIDEDETEIWKLSKEDNETYWVKVS